MGAHSSSGVGGLGKAYRNIAYRQMMQQHREMMSLGLEQRRDNTTRAVGPSGAKGKKGPDQTPEGAPWKHPASRDTCLTSLSCGFTALRSVPQGRTIWEPERYKEPGPGLHAFNHEEFTNGEKEKELDTFRSSQLPRASDLPLASASQAAASSLTTVSCAEHAACRTARTQRAEPAPPSRRPAGSAGGAPRGKPGRRVPLGAHSGPAPRFGSPFGRSLMAERSDLVNVYSPLRGRSARRRRFSLIINAELQTRRNQPAPQCSPGGASPCEATGGHERRNVSGSRARWPRINLRMSRRPPPARRPGAPAPSARGPEAPPARLAPGTLGARGSAPAQSGLRLPRAFRASFYTRGLVESHRALPVGPGEGWRATRAPGNLRPPRGDSGPPAQAPAQGSARGRRWRQPSSPSVSCSLGKVWRQDWKLFFYNRSLKTTVRVFSDGLGVPLCGRRYCPHPKDGLMKPPTLS
ncbi:uncharacterized protein LOC118147880 [Callithrix jacchus]